MEILMKKLVFFILNLLYDFHTSLYVIKIKLDIILSFFLLKNTVNVILKKIDIQ